MKNIPLIRFDISHAQMIWKYAKKTYINGFAEFKEHLKKSNLRIMTPKLSFILMASIAPGNKMFVYFVHIDGSYKSKKAFYFAVLQCKDVFFCTENISLQSRHIDLGDGLYKRRELKKWAA